MANEPTGFESADSTELGATYTSGGLWPGANPPTVDQQAKIDAALQGMNAADARAQVVGGTDVSEAGAPCIGYTKSAEQIGQELQSQGVSLDSSFQDKS